jgi:hypothetical protein
VAGAWAHAERGFGFAFVLAGALEIAVVLGALAWLRWQAAHEHRTAREWTG